MTRQTGQPLDHRSMKATYREAYGWTKEITDGGLLLDPPYQRDDVWTLDQRIDLMESLLRGLPTGVVTIADRAHDRWIGPDPYETGLGIWACVDGRQRLTTACMWYADEFAIPASWLPEDYIETTEDTADGRYVRFSGLTKKGATFIKRRVGFSFSETSDCATVADEARLYVLLNGGGTRQSSADMANAARVAKG